jgi:glyoxylase-like metal-dependent hydrolase (beta-lactamase superfamily II)
MLEVISRRSFLEIGAAAGAAALAPRWLKAQATAAQPTDMVAKARAGALNTAIKTTKLSSNVYLLQGAGGNMVLQTGPQGNLLIDSSFATAVPKITEAIGAVSKAPSAMLINTHWHFDHTDGNEGLHSARFTVYAHQKTRERLSTPQNMKMFGFTLPAAPEGALPVITFNDSMHIWHNGDSLDLVHFDPAHTDTDIYIHFHSADVLHVGDTWFNGMYPFIDEGTGGSIGGMIRASEKALVAAGNETKIVPGHGPLGTKAELQKFHDMLAGVRDKVAALKTAGAPEQEAIAKKPTVEFDPTWAKGMLNGDTFTGIVYRTL